MIPRLKPRLGLAEILAALTPPSKNDVQKFEEAFAKKFSAKYAIAFPYGRTGLIFLIRALGLKDSEIITPAYTCVVVQHAVKFSDNTPTFLDSNKSDFNMDLSVAERSTTSATRGLIATSIFGYPININELNLYKSRFKNVQIIQDCAHSFGASWDGTAVQNQGTAAIYGLNISKLMTSIFGGMVTTNDQDLAKQLRSLRDLQIKRPTVLKSFKRLIYLLAVYPSFWGPVYGFINWLERKGFLNRFVKYYDESKIEMPLDYLEGMTAIEARVGLANLARYDEIISLRQRNAEYYFENLAEISDFQLPPRVVGATYSHFVVLVKDRAWWLKNALDLGVQLGQLIEYSIPEMKSYGSLNRNLFPNAGYFSDHTINLPVHGDLKTAKKVVAVIKELAALKSSV